MTLSRSARRRSAAAPKASRSTSCDDEIPTIRPVLALLLQRLSSWAAWRSSTAPQELSESNVDASYGYGIPYASTAVAMRPWFLDGLIGYVIAAIALILALFALAHLA